MGLYVLKVQYNGAVRRLTLGEVSFEKLQTRIRETFKLPSTSPFQLTYVDKDGDVIMLVGDEDLKDALVFQKLNPLRVKIEALQTGNAEDGAKSMKPTEGVSKDSIPKTVNSDESPKLPEAEASKAHEGTPEANGATSRPAPEIIQGDKEKISAEAGEKSSGADKEAREVGPHQIHQGITCDGCKTNPINGPRFKSTVKPNYDLCGKCYAASGAKENEYVKIDRLFYRIGYPAYAGRLSRRQGKPVCGRADPRPNAEPVEKNGAANIVAVEKPAETQFAHLLLRGAPLGAARCGGPRCGGPLSGRRVWVHSQMGSRPDVDQAAAKGNAQERTAGERPVEPKIVRIPVA